MCASVCVCLYIFLYVYVRLCDKARLNTHQGAQTDNGGGGAFKQYSSRLFSGPSQEPSALYKPICTSPEEHWITTAGGNPN